MLPQSLEFDLLLIATNVDEAWPPLTKKINSPSKEEIENFI